MTLLDLFLCVHMKGIIYEPQDDLIEILWQNMLQNVVINVGDHNFKPSLWYWIKLLSVSLL